MDKKSVYLLLLIVFCLVLIGCNETNQVQQNNSPNHGEYVPEMVSFESDSQQNRTNNTTQERDEIPVNPGREQNIFGVPSDKQGQVSQTDSQGLRTVPNENIQNETHNETLTEFQAEVIELTNNERKAYGLPALKTDQQLTKAAQAKSEDMVTNNYFSHTSPTYGSPFDMLQEFGIEYTTAAENIASGQQSPDEVVTGWMNSSGHRKNILNRNVTHIGVGYASKGDYWTQLFIEK